MVEILDRLPSDIWKIIFDDISFVDILNLRSTCVAVYLQLTENVKPEYYEIFWRKLCNYKGWNIGERISSFLPSTNWMTRLRMVSSGDLQILHNLELQSDRQVHIKWGLPLTDLIFKPSTYGLHIDSHSVERISPGLFHCSSLFELELNGLNHRPIESMRKEKLTVIPYMADRRIVWVRFSDDLSKRKVPQKILCTHR